MILITGAGGLLGANLVADFADRGLEVLAADNAWLPHIPGVHLAPCDLSIDEEAASLMRKWRPTSVIHCAAMTNVDQCEADPKQAWRINVTMPGHLAAYAAEVQSRYIYISTDSVFDGASGCYSETDVPAPINIYARSKLEGEFAVQTKVTNALIVRTNIYGWNMQPKKSLAEWILNQLKSGNEVPGFEDVVFCPLLVNDLGEVLLQMLGRNLTGLYNVAGSEACSKYEFALHIAGAFGLDPSRVQPASLRNSVLQAPRPKNTSLKSEKISGALGRPMPALDAGIERFKELWDIGFVARLKGTGMEETHARPLYS